MIHLNGHKLCAIDCETTGLDPDTNDIVEIAVLPLDFALEYDYAHIPFDIKMAPTNYDNIDYTIITKAKIKHYEDVGFNPLIGADLFIEWLDRLNLPEDKRIVPLGHNWLFDQAFLKKWMGKDAFNLYFDSRYRDTMQCSLLINDSDDFHNERCHFAKNKLSYVAAQLEIEVDYSQLHTAIYDATLTAKVYKKICQTTRML